MPFGLRSYGSASLGTLSNGALRPPAPTSVGRRKLNRINNFYPSPRTDIRKKLRVMPEIVWS